MAKEESYTLAMTMTTGDSKDAVTFTVTRANPREALRAICTHIVNTAGMIDSELAPYMLDIVDGVEPERLV